MIKLTDRDGRIHHLTHDNIDRLTEAGASSQWHGIRTFVKTRDGVTLEVQERVDEIMAHMKGNPSQQLTKADAAVKHVVQRLINDPRLAYLIGPGSESFYLLTDAWATCMGEQVDAFRERLTSKLKPQPVPSIGDECTTVDAELLHRMSLLNNGVLDLDELVNHFIGLGLEAEEARIDKLTEELF